MDSPGTIHASRWWAPHGTAGTFKKKFREAQIPCHSPSRLRGVLLLHNGKCFTESLLFIVSTKCSIYMTPPSIVDETFV